FDRVSEMLPKKAVLSDSRKLLIGAYFTQEYALESAALFNPSMVPHPDQTGLEPGSLRFIMSLRATGEGHISSLTFRTGTIHESLQIRMDPVSPYASTAEQIPNPVYDKKCFARKLVEMGFENDFTRTVLAPLADAFTFQDLLSQISGYLAGRPAVSQTDRLTQDKTLWLARSNYEIRFPADLPVSARVVFPLAPSEQNGIEDARFVRFTEDDGQRNYYATYTAYDGKVILPQLMETSDFNHFKMITLNGIEAVNKGMALFPRRIQGRYAMLSRQDNENLFLMYSDNLHFWNEKELILKPEYPWEFIQLGNCGSPLETKAGWLVFTHGVGAVRRYCIGAVLLDWEDPSHVIGRSREPILAPNEEERKGYVPNVVYSCGALIFNGKVILPYAMSDYTTSVAIIDLDELLSILLSSCSK
ncbi:MAG: glycoside hydrolase family 130 protein, partial [Fibrobacterota bacterium]